MTKSCMNTCALELEPWNHHFSWIDGSLDIERFDVNLRGIVNTVLYKAVAKRKILYLSGSMLRMNVKVTIYTAVVIQDACISCEGKPRIGWAKNKVSSLSTHTLVVVWSCGDVMSWRELGGDSDCWTDLHGLWLLDWFTRTELIYA